MGSVFVHVNGDLQPSSSVSPQPLLHRCLSHWSDSFEVFSMTSLTGPVLQTVIAATFMRMDITCTLSLGPSTEAIDVEYIGSRAEVANLA
jgi:hypothetical protein